MEGSAFCGFQFLMLILLLSTASCSGGTCQLVELASDTKDTNRQHQTIYIGSNTGCGLVPESGEIPTAPLDPKFPNYPYIVRDGVQTLALNISWKLPANATGLNGFIVEILKASYPVGFQQCLQFSVPEPSFGPQFTLDFTLDCWHNLDVDSLYDITIRSLDSGQSVRRRHHTANCYELPEVGNCLVGCQNGSCQGDIPPSDDWKPRNKPTAEVFEDRVTVKFDIYPGNYWLDYRVNLHSYELHTTPDELSHHVNTNGHSGRFTERFEGVKPGRYRADVKIVTGDARQVSSDDFEVMLPVTEAMETTLEEIGLSTDSLNNQLPKKPLTKNDLLKILGIVSASVVIAVCLLVGMVFWKRQKRNSAHSESGPVAGNVPRGSMNQSDDTSDLVNNMHHNDLIATSGQSGQNNDNLYKDKWAAIHQKDAQDYGEPYLQGSIWTGFSDGPDVHTVHVKTPSMFADLGSLGGESGIPV